MITVIKANAQKPQKTKACASPGRGRWRITLPWSITSHTNWRTRGPIGFTSKSGVARDRRMISSTVLKRRQKIARETAINRTKKPRSIHDASVIFFLESEGSMRFCTLFSASHGALSVEWADRREFANRRLGSRGIYCVAHVRPLIGGRSLGGRIG